MDEQYEKRKQEDLALYYDRHIRETNELGLLHLRTAREFVTSAWRERDRMRHALGRDEIFLQVTMADKSVWEVEWEEVIGKIAVLQVGTRDEEEYRSIVDALREAARPQDALTLTWEELVDLGMLQIKLATDVPYTHWWRGVGEIASKMRLVVGHDL